MQSYDDRLTFLLPRPTWVNDADVSCCYSCNNTFGPLRRRHHCRNCGNIYCQDCSSRNVPLPQLGYGTGPVRVCNNCFEVAYLVAYTIDQDHGVSTQIHGVRGLLELVEKDEDKYIHNMVVYGSVDALIWVCRTSKNITLHHLATTVLAILSHKESVRPVIITKWALPALLLLIRNYAQLNPEKESNSFDSQENSENTMTLDILINCTEVLFELSKARILSKKDIAEEGILEIMLILASTGDESQERVSFFQGLAAKTISAMSAHTTLQSSIIQTSDKLAHLLRSPNSEVRKYTAKTIAYLSLRDDKYKPILLSGEGARALISIIARLPLSNGNINNQRDEELAGYLACDVSQIANFSSTESNADATAASHTCCALANFATNNESQTNLMSQPHILLYICNVFSVFPTHKEIHKHIVRCLANLALYEESFEAMQSQEFTVHKHNILPTLLSIGQSPQATTDVIRHVIRAIDNLSSNAQKIGQELNDWKDIHPFVYSVKDMCDKDIAKRANSILQRTSSSTVTTPSDNENYACHPDAEPQEHRLSKNKSKKKK